MKQQLITNNPKTTLFCLGCLSALAMAPVYAWPLMMLGYSTLVCFLVKTPSWKQVSAFTFLFFFGYFLTSFYWVSSSLFVEIDRWWWALPFSFAGLPFILSLFPAILTSIASLAPRFKILSFIIGLIIADIARGYLFTGFPWNLPTHTWTHTDVMMSALPHIGLWGLNSLTILLFCIPALIPNKIKIIYVVLLIAIGFIPIQTTTKSSLPNNIIMVQANIPQHEKWNRDYIWRNFDRHIEMSLSAIKNNDPQVIIWPETAIADGFINSPQPQIYFREFLSSLPKDSVLISGYLNFKDEKAFNSIAVFNTAGDIISKYDKHHLVPFGEYMPFGLDTVTGFSNFSKGQKPETINLENHTFSFTPLICYESVFSRYLSAANKNSLILNLTNDSWFGDTAGPYQHFDHILFRSIESEVAAIRLSGNGISAIIDQNGKAIKLSRLNEMAVISNQ